MQSLDKRQVDFFLFLIFVLEGFLDFIKLVEERHVATLLVTSLLERHEGES